jgi:hypothetical protein
MPIAMLITQPGDARDAVGLFLAGLGWTSVPVAPEPERVRELFAAAHPQIVVADYRGDAVAVADCVAGLTDRGAPIYALNAADERVIDGVVIAREAGDIPRAPGTPAPPHS